MAGDADEAELVRKVAEADRLIITPGTERQYISTIANFLVHLSSSSHSRLLADVFVQAVTRETDDGSRTMDKKLVMVYLDTPTAPETPCPVSDLAGISPHIFKVWLIGLKKKRKSGNDDQAAPEAASIGVLNAARSALFHFYRMYHVPMPPAVEQAFVIFFKGLKKQAQVRKAADQEKIREGKEAFEFPFYQFLCKYLLKRGKKNDSFIHLYLILCWNLMCRAGNAETIKFGHMMWNCDSLAILFAHMKNDQEGERSQHARHVYANPLMPHVCPILALAIYLATREFRRDDVALFPGDKQYARYSKALTKLFNEPEVKQEIEDRGGRPEDFGSHSARKGAPTYTLDGVLEGPHPVQAGHRAGWVFGQVLSRYLKFQATGDQFVGRTVTGLPMGEADFALIAPRFTTGHEAVTRALRCCFPSTPANLAPRILEFCLASLAYHRDWLLATLPANHPLFATHLFSSEDGTELMTELRRLVVCNCGAGDEDGIRPTGVPSHVTLKIRLNDVQARVEQIYSTVSSSFAELPDKLARRVEGVLEERAVQAQAVTPVHLQTALDRLFAESGLRDLINAFQSGNLGAPAAAPAAAPAPVAPASGQSLYYYDGAYHMLPQDYTLPTGTTLVAWRHFCCSQRFGPRGDLVPPLSTVQPSDFACRKQRKRSADLRFLMQRIVRRLRDMGEWVERPTESQADRMYAAARDAVAPPSESSGGSTGKARKRRVAELRWTSLVQLVRAREKRQSGDEAPPHQGAAEDARERDRDGDDSDAVRETEMSDDTSSEEEAE